MRRAGFAFRRSYDLFLKRYKSLCNRTWPSYNKDEPKQGVIDICNNLGLIEDDDFSLGKYDFYSIYQYYFEKINF